MLSISPSRATLRQGDRTPAPRWRVEPAISCCGDGDEEAPINPALWTGWTLRLIGLTTVTIALTYDATTGELVGTWPVGSTDVAGQYLGILQATEIATGYGRTFPTAEDVILVIVPLPS